MSILTIKSLQHETFSDETSYWNLVGNGECTGADDIALYKIIQSPVDYLLVQKDINAISEWVSDNYLFLNFLLFFKKETPNPARCSSDDQWKCYKQCHSS